MTLQDFYPGIIVVLLVVGLVAALRIFFTLWQPIERAINGDRFAVSKDLAVQFKNKTVDVHLKSKTVFESVVLLGYCSVPRQAPFHLGQLLMVRFADGRIAYFRMEEVEYLEEQAELAPSEATRPS